MVYDFEAVQLALDGLKLFGLHRLDPLKFGAVLATSNRYERQSMSTI